MSDHMLARMTERSTAIMGTVSAAILLGIAGIIIGLWLFGGDA
jgi:hypothetical protein